MEVVTGVVEAIVAEQSIQDILHVTSFHLIEKTDGPLHREMRGPHHREMRGPIHREMRGGAF